MFCIASLNDNVNTLNPLFMRSWSNKTLVRQQPQMATFINERNSGVQAYHVSRGDQCFRHLSSSRWCISANENTCPNITLSGLADLKDLKPFLSNNAPESRRSLEKNNRIKPKLPQNTSTTDMDASQQMRFFRSSSLATRISANG